jgi:hypothetical protein
MSAYLGTAAQRRHCLPTHTDVHTVQAVLIRAESGWKRSTGRDDTGPVGAAVALSLVASALTALCAVPQLHRALRDTRGVSVSAWLQSFALGAFWGPTGWPPARGYWWPARARSHWGA